MYCVVMCPKIVYTTTLCLIVFDVSSQYALSGQFCWFPILLGITVNVLADTIG